MLDVLIVDDEPAALRSLRSLIPWEDIGYRISGEAANGEQALQLFEEESFDLVITDIRMPRMDGLQLIAKLREQSDVRAILLSGYGEFEYARRGLQLGIQDYLLKPVGTDELIEKLKAIKAQIESEALEEKKWYHGLPLMREQLVRRLARGLLGEVSTFADLGLLPEGGRNRYCVMIVELPDMGDGHGQPQGHAQGHAQGQPQGHGRGPSTPSGRELHLRRFAVRNVIEEAGAGSGLLFEESPNRFGIVCSTDNGCTEPEELPLARRLREEVLRYAKVPIAIAIGHWVESFEEVPSSYESAVELMDKRHLLAAASTSSEPIWQADQVRKNHDSKHLLVEEVKQYIRERFADNIELKQLARELFVNPNHLGQLFRSHTGLTFKEYLLQVRMDAAKDLLLYTDKKVYEIAQEVGFKELDWFYKKFKQHTGTSANEFRAER